MIIVRSPAFTSIDRTDLPLVRYQKAGTPEQSKLKLLVPMVGNFFTPVFLRDAFLYQDARRYISSRRFVAPSFNDVRLILNTAQIIALVRQGPLRLVTFDGDVTLYDDGQSLSPENPAIPRIINLLKQDICVGIVTAAGYTEAGRYYDRLHGLLDALHSSDLNLQQQSNLIVMGGESNFLFRFDGRQKHRLISVPKKDWMLEEMTSWTEDAIADLLDVAQGALQDCLTAMHLDGQILRKARAVGIVPKEGQKFAREQLEETVLVTQKILVRLSHVFDYWCGQGLTLRLGDVSCRETAPILCLQWR